MEIISYLKKGTRIISKNFDFNNDNFNIQYSEKSGYIYSGDELYNELNSEFITLNGALRDYFFMDNKEYYNELEIMPSFVQNLGIDSDDSNSKDFFEKMILKYKLSAPNLFKHLYLIDAQAIVSAIQNLVIGMEGDFIEYYKKITQVGSTLIRKDGLNKVTGDECDRVASVLGSYFVRCNSILDLVTKIAFEFESKDYDFTSYNKLKCAKVLYGGKKKLEINNFKDTLFVRDCFIKEIESIRNEIIHNGSWEMLPKVFCLVKDDCIVERYMYYPDMMDGHYSKHVNRYHFYSSGKKVNDELPRIHMTFLKRLLETILKLCNPKVRNYKLHK